MLKHLQNIILTDEIIAAVLYRIVLDMEIKTIIAFNEV